MLLAYLSAAWLAGIFIGSVFYVPPAFILLVLVPLPLAWLMRQHWKSAAVISVCLGFFLGGMVYYQMRLPFAEVKSVPVEWIAHLRNSAAAVLSRVLPEPQASLAQGIILGLRENIPEAVRSDFARTGTTHILAISGQNLSIFAGLVVALGGSIFGRRHYVYIWLALAALWLYALLTGMEPPVVRGAIMASVFLFADLVGRQRSAFTALAAAAAVMVAFAPSVLWEVSFHLSFLAMSGLIFIYPKLHSAGRKVAAARLNDNGLVASSVNVLIEGMSVSLGAVLGVWPLLIHYFGLISWAGPLATFVAVPAMPCIIVFGVLTGLVGLIALPLAQVISWILWLFLTYLLLVVKAFSFVPVTDGVGLGAVPILSYYAVLALAIWLAGDTSKLKTMLEWLKSGKDRVSALLSRLSRKWATVSLSVMAALIWTAVFTMPDTKLHAVFLDVGQGDAALFQKGSRQILFDGGPDERELLLALGRAMPYWDRTIELVVMTHPHADHIDGLLGVLEKYRVKQVVYADFDQFSAMYDDWLNLTEGWRAAITEGDIPYEFASAGQRFTIDAVTIEILNPQSPALSGSDSDIDNNGVVARLRMGEVSFLITGDLMWEGEAELIANRAALESTVIKVGHHGSSTSTGDAFLGAVDPQAAVISVGKNNPFGHPDKAVMKRLEANLGRENIYRTDENGTIEFVTDGTKLWVKQGK